jgi:hypothetical protein
MRAELDLITVGLDKLPALSANSSKAVVVNGGGTALTVTTGTLALAGNFSTIGAYSIALTATASTTLTLPTTGTLATLAGSETLTTKTINLSSNTLTGTITQFNTACSDADFATIAGSEALSNKTLTAPILSGSVTGTYTLAGTPTITSPTISSPVFSGSATGTYTLAGTPTIAAPTFSGAASGSLSALALTSAVLTTSTVAADPTAALGIASKQYVDGILPSTVATYSSNDTLDDGVGLAILAANASDYTITLPAAASHTNREVTFIHTANNHTITTIQGNGAETIIAADGTANTYKLYTIGESLRIKSNGTSWYVVMHDSETEWLTFDTITITGTTSDPTKPSSLDIDTVSWKRTGNTCHLRYVYQASSAAGSAAGSGNYVFALPDSFTIESLAIDTDLITPVATTLSAAVRSEAASSTIDGDGYITVDSSSTARAIFLAKTTTTFQVLLTYTTDAATADMAIMGAAYPLSTAEMGFVFSLRVRIAGWRL